MHFSQIFTTALCQDGLPTKGLRWSFPAICNRLPSMHSWSFPQIQDNIFFLLLNKIFRRRHIHGDDILKIRMFTVLTFQFSQYSVESNPCEKFNTSKPLARFFYVTSVNVSLDNKSGRNTHEHHHQCGVVIRTAKAAIYDCRQQIERLLPVQTSRRNVATQLLQGGANYGKRYLAEWWDKQQL